MSNPALPDQRDLWIAVYGDNDISHGKPSALVAPCLNLLPPASRILELGCGAGQDAEAFAVAGHTVIATDFVTGLIATNQARLARLPGLEFRDMRIDAPYPFADATFDAVYAHLTLHYFPHDITLSIVAEIHRVLRPGGWLMFACKSTDDPAWGRGVEIEPDMFALNGKVRHFFTETYARSLLEPGFHALDISSHTGKLHRQKSGWMTAMARRSDHNTT